MDIALLIFPRLTALDAIGPYEVLQRLPGARVKFGATPTSERVVEEGKIITAAGVSSGIDMALRLAAHVAGDEVAQAIQLGIEYDPQPPFDSGSLAKASDAIRELTFANLVREATP